MNETKEDAVNVFDLIVRDGNLPVTLDRLVPMSFIGQTAVNFYREKVKLMDRLGMTEDQRKATLKDGQDAGRMLLEIEARIGELWESIPPTPGVRSQEKRGQSKEAIAKQEGLTKNRATKSSIIHRNPAAVAAVIREAEENEDIPTKTAVLNKIHAQKTEERLREAQAYAAERFDKKMDKEVKEHPKAVKEYLDAMKIYRDALRFAIEAAKRDMFAPESYQFIRNGHNGIKVLMDELEETENE